MLTLATRWNRLCFVAALAGTLLVAGLASAVEKETREPSEYEAWWVDLEKSEPEASRALLELAAAEEKVIPFLEEKLLPLKNEDGQIEKWLEELGSEDEQVWKNAYEQLEYFDPRLAMHLEGLMLVYTESPTRQRLVEILSQRAQGSLEGQEINLRPLSDGQGYNFTSTGSWWAEHDIARLNSTPWGNPKKKWTRAVRAIVLLQHIGTPEAYDVIERMAGGDSDAQPTRVAKDVLRELIADGRTGVNGANGGVLESRNDDG